MDGLKDKYFNGLVILVYMVVVGILVSFHEVWRDEVVPVSLVAESGDIWELMRKMANYGHPGFWAVLLYAGYKIVPHYYVVKILTVTIATAAVYIFLVRSPFPKWQKVLFTAGFYPLYLYPVYNRSYGLSMLLMFLFASLYRNRFKNIIPLSVILFLLANTHAHSWIIVFMVFCSLAAEYLFQKEKGRARLDPWVSGACFVLVAAGLVSAAVMMIPEQTSTIFQARSLNIVGAARACFNALILPGKYFYGIFGLRQEMWVNVVIWGIYFYLSRNVYLLMIFTGGVAGLGMFFEIIYPSGGMRHEGALFLLIVLVFWIDRIVDPGCNVSWGGRQKLGRAMVCGREFFLTVLFIVHLCIALPAIRKDIMGEYSSSKSFGEFIHSRPDLKDAILMGEPAANLEALPYYVDNPVYIAREGRFRKFREFTTAGREEFSLDELLTTAQQLKARFKRPVLIVFGHPVTTQGPFKISFSYGQVFTFSRDSINAFLSETKKIAHFDGALSDENYRVYELK
jgi:hypothetical protein